MFPLPALLWWLNRDLNDRIAKKKHGMARWLFLEMVVVGHCLAGMVAEGM